MTVDAVEDLGTLPADMQTCLVFAARYAHDRNTSGAYLVTRALLSNWDKLSPNTQKQLHKEARNEATCNLEDWALILDAPISH